MTTSVRLSILIPAIPSRIEQATRLYRSLQHMAEGKEIEVVLLLDNKVMSIGEKCNRLLECVHGRYFIILHDDDGLESLEEIYSATQSDVDVICFNALCTNSDGSTYVVRQRLGFEVEHNTLDGRYLDCKRPPFPNCAWNSYFARTFNFPPVSYAEDWGFISQCLRVAKTEVYIDKVLFKYNFNPITSEASTLTNEIWTNPNV